MRAQHVKMVVKIDHDEEGLYAPRGVADIQPFPDIETLAAMVDELELIINGRTVSVEKLKSLNEQRGLPREGAPEPWPPMAREDAAAKPLLVGPPEKARP